MDSTDLVGEKWNVTIFGVAFSRTPPNQLESGQECPDSFLVTLNPSRNPPHMFKRYWWILLVIAPVGMVCGFLIASVVTYVMPKEYESYATIEVKPHRSSTGGGYPTMTPMFFRTEFEKIISRNSLTKVAENLDLPSRWGIDSERVLYLLREIVKTENIRGTDLISITVRHTDRESARDITAEVANVYKEYRMELQPEPFDKTVSELKNAFREQEDKVEERRKVLTKISRTGPMIYQESEDSKVRRTESYKDAKRDFETEQALLEQMKLSLLGEGLVTKSRFNSVVIHDYPVISNSPVSPNVTLNLVLGAVGGLLLSPFLALPLMWFLHRRNPVIAG